MATESITKKTIVKGSNDIIPNYVAREMDATEGTYAWNYTLRNCPEEEWEELYKGKLGILEDGGHVGPDGRPEGMVKTRKGSDHMWQEDAQHTPSACVCGVE
jgi:hypothetical protein